jgi:hypothetical protein
MIHPIANVKTQTESLSTVNHDLTKAGRVQARTKGKAAAGQAPAEGYLWGPMNSGPYLVPIIHWIE